MGRIWLPEQEIEDEVLRQQRRADSFVFVARAQRREVLAGAIKFNERLRLAQIARYAKRQRGVAMVNSFFGFGGAGGDPSYANVRLLLDLNGNVTDYSGTPTTMTLGSGAAQSTTRVPFGSSTDSVKFNGVATGNFLSSGRLPAMGTGAFTFEAMIRPNAAQKSRVVSCQDLTNSNAVVAYRVDAAGSVTSILRDNSGSGTSVITSASGLIAMNDTLWYSFAMTRSGAGAIAMLINASSVATGTATTDPTGTYNAYNIGSYYGGLTGGTPQEYFGGYIASVRVTEGVARTIVTPTGYFPHS